MYLPTARGETQIPSLTNNSLGMRSSPNKTFSMPIRVPIARWSSGVATRSTAIACSAREVRPSHGRSFYSAVAGVILSFFENVSVLITIAFVLGTGMHTAPVMSSSTAPRKAIR